MPESEPKPVCLLLPGTDGTGVFFADLAAYLKQHAEIRILTYPSDQVMDYNALCQYLLPSIPTEDDYILIAESFAGPLAIMLADKVDHKPSRIILAASFCKAPWPMPAVVLRLLLSVIAWIRPPKWFLEQLLLSPRNRHLSKQIVATIQLIDREVLNARLYSALTCDLTQMIRKLAIPILYLRGKNDRLIPASCAEVFVQLAHDVTIAEVSSAHFVLQDSVDRLSEDVLIPFIKVT